MPRFLREQSRHPRLQPDRPSPEASRPKPEGPDRAAFSPALRYPELDRYPQERKAYRLHEQQRYFLRQSEIYTMAEAGKFRALSIEDLEKYLYSGDRQMMLRDLSNLTRQGLIRKSAGHYSDPIQVVTLTRQGETFMREVLRESKQELYSGLNKVRELRHDTALYQVYQAKAQEIEEGGGRIKRIVLDYELKRKLNRELNKGKDLAPSEDTKLKEDIGQRHGVPVVEGQYLVPDVRIEFEDRDGIEWRVDLEYLTETYRHGDISGKAQAGFALYASHDQAPRLHRVLHQHQIMTEILSI
jgi:DNA-binding MarR family transcriptional regulator